MNEQGRKLGDQPANHVRGGWGTDGAFRTENPAAYLGLTKRELFAAMAMQGMLSNPAICDMTSGEASQVALWANQCADALLAELAKDGAP